MGLKQNSAIHRFARQFVNTGLELWESDGVPTESGPKKGALAVDTTNGNLYINQGTASAATWVLFSALGASITRSELSTAAASKSIQTISASIATTSTTDTYVIVPETGTLTGVDFSSLAALAAHDSNYITWTITNLGQAGSGTAVMLAATDANTTKATGGTALSANTKRSFTLTGTAADLNVVAGDRLLIRATATGTLAGAVTVPTYLLRFGGTT